MIRFGRAICGDLAQAERREWWLSNGLGGYAAGTIAGSLTRRYHGLLIAPLRGALDRQLLLAKAEATLSVDGRAYPLSCNHWQSGSIQPRGHVHIESFRLDGLLPVWVYAIAGTRIEQRIFMERGEHAVWVIFRRLGNLDARPPRLDLRLLIDRRDHHGQTASGSIAPGVRARDERTMIVDHDDETRLHLQLDSGRLETEYTWVEDFLLPIERERGLADWDNHLAVGHARLTLDDNDWHGVRAGLSAIPEPDPTRALKHERSHVFAFPDKTDSPTPAWIGALMANAGQFLFDHRRKDHSRDTSIIAGYPWFGDWGRDTMIALPGLTLATGNRHLARKILASWAGYVDQGMIPNRFPEAGAGKARPEYNSVDASLWFILAWHSWLRAGGKRKHLRKVFPVLEAIIEAYRRGTRYRIHLDESHGLLHIGDADTQLTWMDARVAGRAVTPRSGKPVEINALWFNALRAMRLFSERLGQDGARYASLAERARLGFVRYQRPDGGLYDALDTPDGDDASIRPNQLFALSLPYPLLDKKTARRVLQELREHLLTSYGLRSLSPRDPAYRGRYRGSVAERDGAYHNGPAWGWLLGHYAIAHWRLHGDKAAALALLEAMRDHLFDAGLGGISELFDGDAPHAPRGAPMQAWSVATVLEAWWVIRQGHADPDA